MSTGALALPGLVESLGKDPCIVGGGFGNGLADGPAKLYAVGGHAVHPGTANHFVYNALAISVKAKRNSKKEENAYKTLRFVQFLPVIGIANISKNN